MGVELKPLSPRASSQLAYTTRALCASLLAASSPSTRAALPVVFIATQDEVYEKVVSNIQEVKARGGQILAIVTEGDKKVPSLADHVLEIPKVDDALTPLLTVVPLQILSYHIALKRGCNVDQPRNLAKSVTVE